MTRELLQQALNALNSTNLDLHADAVEAIRAHLAQPQSEPAWHDAPTVPGLWVVGSRCLHINELDLPIYERSNCRWFGPVPDDGGKP